MFRSSVPTAPSVPVQGRSFVCRRIRIQKPSLKHLVSSLQQQQQQQQQHQPNINSTHLLGFLMGRFLSPQSSSSNSQSLILRDCDLLVDRFDLGRRSAAPNNNVTGAGPLMRVPTVAMDGDVLLHIFVKHNTHPSTADMCLEDEEGFVKMKQMCTDIIRNTATPFISHSWPCCILLEDMGTHVKADYTQLIPAVDLRFIPIPPIRIVSTMLLSQLITPSRSSAPPTITNTTTDTTNSLSFDLLKQFGFITIDQSRNILLLDHADPRVADFRLAGIWLKNIDSVNSLFTYTTCIQYIYCNMFQKFKLGRPLFLVAVFPPNIFHIKQVQFYECHFPENTLLEHSEIKFHAYCSAAELSHDLECIPPCVLDVELQAPLKVLEKEKEKTEDVGVDVAIEIGQQQRQQQPAEASSESQNTVQEEMDNGGGGGSSSSSSSSGVEAGIESPLVVEGSVSNPVVDSATSISSSAPTNSNTTVSVPCPPLTTSPDALMALQQHFLASMLQSQLWIQQQQQQQQGAGSIIPAFNYPFFPLQTSLLHPTPSVPVNAAQLSTVSVATITDQPPTTTQRSIGTQSITTPTNTTTTRTQSTQTELEVAASSSSNLTITQPAKPALVSVCVGPDNASAAASDDDARHDDEEEHIVFDYESGAEVEDESPTLLGSDRELTSLKRELAEGLNISAVPTLPTDTGSNYRPFYQYEDIDEENASNEKDHLPRPQLGHPSREQPVPKQQLHQQQQLQPSSSSKRKDAVGFVAFKRNSFVSPVNTPTTSNPHFHYNHHRTSPVINQGIYNRDFSISSTQNLVSQRNSILRASAAPNPNISTHTSSTTTTNTPAISATNTGGGGGGGGQEIIARLASHPEQSFIYSERDGSEWVGRKRGTITDKPLLRVDSGGHDDRGDINNEYDVDDTKNDDEALDVEEEEEESDLVGRSSIVDHSSNMMTIDQYSKSTIDYLKRYNLI